MKKCFYCGKGKKERKGRFLKCGVPGYEDNFYCHEKCYEKYKKKNKEYFFSNL